jgi:hypothetical protein
MRTAVDMNLIQTSINRRSVINGVPAIGYSGGRLHAKAVGVRDIVDTRVITREGKRKSGDELGGEDFTARTARVAALEQSHHIADRKTAE